MRGILVRPKDKREAEKHEHSGYVYQYECECGKVYVGKWGETCFVMLQNTEERYKRGIVVQRGTLPYNDMTWICPLNLYDQFQKKKNRILRSTYIHVLDNP